MDKDVLLTGGIPPLLASTTVESKFQKNAKYSLIAEHPHKKDRRKKRFAGFNYLLFCLLILLFALGPSLVGQIILC